MINLNINNTMIQEYLALGIFITAIVFTAISLVRFIISQIKNTGNPACEGQCSCNVEKKLSLKTLSVKGNSYRSVRLK